MDRTTLRVLVLEPDDSARTAITWQLEAAGFAVSVAADGRRTLELLTAPTGPVPQLLVVDVDAEGVRGIDVLRRIRASATALEPSVPVVLTSSRPSAAERIAAFDCGADDYLGKPIVPEEFEARVRSLLRRLVPDRPGRRVVTGPEVALGTLRVDPAARQVTLAGHRVELTAREFDLLHFLAGHPGQVFSRAQLLRSVWGDGTGTAGAGAAGEATVTEHVHRLRRKLGSEVLATVRGVGYRLDRAG